jgi:HD-GYP domain-containing protein (c-di-GMP phosphodiesterase class II)
LHDIGKIGIPYGILTKEGKLTFEEYEIIKKHSEYGYQLIKDLKMLSDQIKNSVRFHHKRFDLKGYPEEHLEFMDTMSSIIGIADAIDAMTSKRKYNNIMTNDQVITELIKNSGTQFDPEIVEATVELIKNNGLDNLIQEVKDGE